MHFLAALRGFVAFSLAALSCGDVAAGEWPQWRGPNRTGHAAADEKPLARLPETPRTVWKVPAGEGFASPVVAGGSVFAMDTQDGKETLRALDIADGHELWRTPVDDTFKDSQGPAAPRCTPVAWDGRVYAQSCKGELLCVSAADGKKLWSVNYTRDFGAVFTGEKGNAPGATRHGNNGSPWVEAGWLFASAGSTNGAGVVALDPKTGAMRWKGGNEIAAYAAPMVATIEGTRQVVDFMADAVVGFDATDGRVLWRYPMKTAFARHVVTPLVIGNRIVVGSHQTALIALRISRDGDGWKAAESWKNKDATPSVASPVAVGDLIFALGPQRDVLCVDASDGHVRWTKTGWINSPADKANAGFVVVGGNSILMLNDGGELVLFAADGAECKELGRVQVCGATWCNPAYSNGRLYLRDGIKTGGSWMCVELAR